MVHSANNSSLLNLSNLPQTNRYFVAYSGGMDSTALLHALCQTAIKPKLTAIHVNHNIDSHSAQWENQCAEFCHHLGVRFISRSVTLTDYSENSCRLARQNIYSTLLETGDCLITGHHQSDQIETVIFRLFRGTGIHGISGMSETAKHHEYVVYRPMLQTSKDLINEYVLKHQLTFVTDPSNQNNAYSRNFIRNQLSPIIHSYSADAFKQIELSAHNIRYSNQLLADLVGSDNPLPTQKINNTKSLPTLLYHWLHNLNVVPPGHKQLTQFSLDCSRAANDKHPRLDTPDYHLIHWNNQIYALKNRSDIEFKELKISWQKNDTVELPNQGGLIQLFAEEDVNLVITIRYQQGGEKINIKGHSHRLKIKNLFQSNRTPPWIRQFIPYLYINNHLMAVGNDFISAEFKQLLNRHKAEYQWLSPQFIL